MSLFENKISNKVFVACVYSLEMCEEEGGGCVELVPGGREMEVTALNVYEYVRKYAQHRMLLSQEKALEVIFHPFRNNFRKRIERKITSHFSEGPGPESGS